MLQLAKLIFNNKVSFGYTVVLIAFSGEEQGLYGSAYSAQQVCQRIGRKPTRERERQRIEEEYGGIVSKESTEGGKRRWSR